MRRAPRMRSASLRPSAFAQDFAYYDQDAERVRGWFAPSVEKHKAEAARAEALRVDDDDTVVFHLRFAKPSRVGSPTRPTTNSR